MPVESDIHPSSRLDRAIRPVRAHFERRLAGATGRGIRKRRPVEGPEAEFRGSISVASLRRLFDGLAQFANLGLPRLGQIIKGVPLHPDSSATVDVLIPDGPGPHPVLVYLHGGAWVAGSPASHRKLTARFAEAGYLVVSVDYRLAPEHPFPAGLEDCIAAVRWTVGNAHRYGGDSSRLAIGGDSAGANLAAATLISLRGVVAAPKISAAVFIYGVFDMRTMGGPGVDRYLQEAYLPGEPADRLLDPAVSPKYGADQLPPSFIVVGSQDGLVSQSRELRDLLIANSTPNVYVEADGMPHGFMQMEFLGGIRDVVRQAGAFLEEQLAESPRTRLRGHRMRLGRRISGYFTRSLRRRTLRVRLIERQIS